MGGRLGVRVRKLAKSVYAVSGCQAKKQATGTLWQTGAHLASFEMCTSLGVCEVCNALRHGVRQQNTEPRATLAESLLKAVLGEAKSLQTKATLQQRHGKMIVTKGGDSEALSDSLRAGLAQKVRPRNEIHLRLLLQVQAGGHAYGRRDEPPRWCCWQAESLAYRRRSQYWAFQPLDE